MTTIKKMVSQQSGTHKLVEVTLEKDGKEYKFTAKATDVLDEQRFASLLRVWDEQAIPEIVAEKALTDKGVEEMLEKRKKMKVG